MTNIQKFLDTKHCKFIGRVYLLLILFVFNAMIPIGAAMYYQFSMTNIVMYLGILGTVVTILILSTPSYLEKGNSAKQ